MSCKVYVGNLAWATDDPTLGAHFASIGNIKDAVVMRSEGRSRGFGFVTFSSVQEAERAIATMNDTELEGRRLRVNVASQQIRSSGTEWAANETSPSYMQYAPMQYNGGSGYPPPQFGGHFAQPGFVGYPPGSGYNSSNSATVLPMGNNQPGYYQQSNSTQYPYPSTGYGQPQQQQQPY
ncbi:hypothetical protein CROQUDRAFT_665078 [Cronartium quercuum f. sp. fusiforme G11]|uniref:RRM domain-containing protein n=1 Tax=Cronartium quercuum f. sp. fusiforme G11 TaxID=708437 RepID=A0A9P6N7N7_9BASI|nr:hypothetical protein CROQUDRAFT_665078 [Cronartium quercuum f. sp. fusiforme G11]